MSLLINVEQELNSNFSFKQLQPLGWWFNITILGIYTGNKNTGFRW